MTEKSKSSIDFLNKEDAELWAKTAPSRKGRAQIFQLFRDTIKDLEIDNLEVLEIGSGPGFLSQYLLEKIDCKKYSCLDFSPHMHEMARTRNQIHEQKIEYILKDIREDDWFKTIGKYDVTLTNQALHEVRDKSRAVELHRQIGKTLKNGGVYLYCDHFCGDGGLVDDEIYMTQDEQLESLFEAGYGIVIRLGIHGSLALYFARK